MTPTATCQSQPSRPTSAYPASPTSTSAGSAASRASSKPRRCPASRVTNTTLSNHLVFALNRYAANPESDDAGLAHWLYSLGTTFIFFRTTGSNPLTIAEMRRRAALLVTSVSNMAPSRYAGTTSPPTPCAGASRKRPVAHVRRRRSMTTTASHPRPSRHWLSASARYARPPSSPRVASSVKHGDPFNPPPRWTRAWTPPSAR